MVVADLKIAMDSMWQNFGIAPWRVFTYLPEQHVKETMYCGKPSKSGMKLAFCNVGKIQFELIEAIGEDNIYHEFVKKNGNGIQHLGLHKIKTEQEFFAVTKKLEAAGYPCIWSGRSPRARFGYFDTVRSLNTILECVWLDPDAPSLEPDYIYPTNN
jgi:methylmalonyl-CoA/ethylmalonyl-CoA epimerase